MTSHTSAVRPVLQQHPRGCSADSDEWNVHDIAAIGDVAEKHDGIGGDDQRERDPGPTALDRLAYHEPMQAQKLHEDGNDIKLVRQHAAEDDRHLAFEPLQNEVGQPDNQATAKPAHPVHAAAVSGEKTDADREHCYRGNVCEEVGAVVHSSNKLARTSLLKPKAR
ncbi:MAG TPA: hypothetical protein VGF96_10505 [Terracidiphilus sp.]